MEKSNIIKFPNEDEVRYKEAKDTLDKFYDDSKLKASVALLSGWEGMRRSHYNERVKLDEGPPRVDYSWVRKIVEPIYARLRRSRKRK